MGNIHIFSAVLSGVAATGSGYINLPTSTPAQMQLTLQSQNANLPTSNLTVACTRDQETSPYFSNMVNWNNVSVGDSLTIEVPGAPTDMTLFCSLSGIDNTGFPLFFSGSTVHMFPPPVAAFTIGVGQVPAGSPSSYMAAGSEFVQTAAAVDGETNQDVGVRAEAWYRCLPGPMPAPPANSPLENITLPDGILAAQSGIAGDSNTLMWAFSHSRTQLCGTATRFLEDANGTSEVTMYQACSVEYPSTAGSWVHGAMVFDSRSAAFTFFLNGVPLQSVSSYDLPSYNSTARMPGADPSGLITLISAKDNAGHQISVSNGTAVDNIRILRVQDNFAADIAATYNQPFQSKNESVFNNTIVYAEFHAGANLYINDILTIGRDLSGVGTVASISQVTVPHFLTPTSTIRSCDQLGCGPHDTTYVAPSAASSTGSGASSSTGTGGASSSSSSSSSSTGCDGATCAGSLAAPSFLIALAIAAASFFRIEA